MAGKVGARKAREGKATGEGKGAGGDVAALTDATFDGFVAANPRAVVDCWASWCGPCMMMGPVVEEVARAQAGTVAFGKLDVDANSRVPDRYGVRSIPTLLVFRDGRLAGTIVGSRPRKELEREIEKAMG